MVLNWKRVGCSLWGRLGVFVLFMSNGRMEWEVGHFLSNEGVVPVCPGEGVELKGEALYTVVEFWIMSKE